MAKKSIQKVAAQASSRSRLCLKCPFNRHSTMCSVMICEMCDKAFREGFVKGAKYMKSNL